MPSQLKTIAICSKGDPRSPRTWSGTPAALCRSFEAAGVRVEGVNCYGQAPRPIELGLKVLSKLYYLNSRYARLGRIEHPWRARRASALLSQAAETDHVLHLHALDSLSLPIKRDGNKQHSIVLDTTWNLWRRYCTDVFRVSSRLADDADRMERAVFHAAAHCFPLSDYVARDLIEHYGVPAEKITVIGTGRGALLPYDGPKDYGNGSILFAAKERFIDKGGALLLQAFQIAHGQNANLSLTIVGRPEYEAQFRDIDGVTARGHVTLEELQSLFNQASLFAMPAVFEPWGLVYLEALACKTPVMGLRDHALPEITRNGRYGFCLENNSAEAMAEALLDAFTDPLRLERMGSEGQKHCLAHYTWEKTVERILTVLCQD